KYELNPLIDCLFRNNDAFAFELDFLSRDRIEYELDLERARKAVVSVPVLADDEFDAFYKQATETPLLDDKRDLRHEHTRDSAFRYLDGIYIRDPRSLLFKEWARQDAQRSSLGRGFTFTAVAYSNEHKDAVKNQTGYHFALAPEHSG